MTTTLAPDRLARAIRDADLDTAKASAIVETFGPIYAEAGELTRASASITVTDEKQTDAMKAARAMRLKLKALRTSADKAHEVLKADALKVGQVLDRVRREIRGYLEPEEKRLEECERFAEVKEAARKAEYARVRGEMLREAGADPTIYADLGGMLEESFEAVLEVAEAAQRARLEQARQAELARREAEAARQAEQDRLKAENERLKQEREAAQKAAVLANTERMRAESEALSAQGELIAKRRADADRLMAEETAERARAAEEEHKQRAAAAAPDREKLLAVAQAFASIELPQCVTPEGLKVRNEIEDKVKSLVYWIRADARTIGGEGAIVIEDGEVAG